MNLDGWDTQLGLADLVVWVKLATFWGKGLEATSANQGPKEGSRGLSKVVAHSPLKLGSFGGSQQPSALQVSSPSQLPVEAHCHLPQATSSSASPSLACSLILSAMDSINGCPFLFASAIHKYECLSPCLHVGCSETSPAHFLHPSDQGFRGSASSSLPLVPLQSVCISPESRTRS